GALIHSGDRVYTKSRYETGDHIGLELNMETSPRTLSLFINGVLQKDIIRNIPKQVRIMVYLAKKENSFKVLQFERIPTSAAAQDKPTEWSWYMPWVQTAEEIAEVYDY
ncbi:MAG: hypothetical protein EZS28_019335, partial [Streblomastix strix]